MKLQEFSGIRILEWFLRHPTRKIHFKELCRELGLGPLTVKTYCEELIKREWLLQERNANLRIFYLNGSSWVAKALKRAYFLEQLRKEKIGALVDETAISLALYGSHASGEYDEKSDIDILVIGRKERVDYRHAKRLEKRLGKSLQITVFPWEKWEGNRQRDPFMLSVIKNHVLLKGAQL